MNQVRQSPGMMEAVTLRPVRESDAELLLTWANSPKSLAAKLKTTAPIARETHQAWLSKRLNSANAGIWIAERNGRPVGQVRAERGEDAHHDIEVDIFVVPEARGSGTGLAMLDMLAARCAERWPGVAMIALIKSGHTASLRLFARAGFAEFAAATDHLVYRRFTKP